jgi:hypothetical protein
MGTDCAAATVGMGNGISTAWRAAAPRSRAVKRTLSFRLDIGDSRIKLETLLGHWGGAAAHEHDRPDDRMP